MDLPLPLPLLRSFEWVRYFENAIRIILNRNATLERRLETSNQSCAECNVSNQREICKRHWKKADQVNIKRQFLWAVQLSHVSCWLLCERRRRVKGDLCSTMLSWAQQCYPPAIHVLTHLHVQEKSENGFVKFTFFVSHIYPKKKMSVRRHFAPNFRLWTSTQLCKNQTSNGNRATMSCIFCEEVLGLTFPEQTPCCIIHVLLVISAISISFLLLLYLCISSSSNDQMMRSTVFLKYY